MRVAPPFGTPPPQALEPRRPTPTHAPSPPSSHLDFTFHTRDELRYWVMTKLAKRN